MKTLKLSIVAFTLTVFTGGVAAVAAQPGDVAPILAVSETMSADQLAALLHHDIPPNCIEYTTGEGECLYIRCGVPTQPGDWPRGLYACEPH